MASRATPPHQFISAPRTPMTALMISALAGSTTTRANTRVKQNGLGNIDSHLLWGWILDLPPAERVGRLAGAMIFLQFLVGMHNRRQFLRDLAQLRTRQGEIQLIVRQAGVDPIANAAQT